MDSIKKEIGDKKKSTKGKINIIEDSIHSSESDELDSKH